jgi:hypothetical protein
VLQSVEIIADPLDDLRGVRLIAELLPQTCLEDVLVDC